MLFYDNRGNRNSRLVNGREEYYTYDPRNRLTDLMIDLRNTHYEYECAKISLAV